MPMLGWSLGKPQPDLLEHQLYQYRLYQYQFQHQLYQHQLYRCSSLQCPPHLRQLFRHQQAEPLERVEQAEREAKQREWVAGKQGRSKRLRH